MKVFGDTVHFIALLSTLQELVVQHAEFPQVVSEPVSL